MSVLHKSSKTERIQDEGSKELVGAVSIGLLDRADTVEVETGLSSRASATVSLSVVQ